MRRLRAFGAFWYDFLVGDRPELFVGPIVALLVAWLLLGLGLGGALTALVLFASVLAILAGGLYLSLRPRD